MSYTGNKVYNIFINSASALEKTYDFNLFFDNDELIIILMRVLMFP